jgi:hypothetical protein
VIGKTSLRETMRRTRREELGLSDRTDEELLVRLRVDQAAFVAFYDRHVDEVVRFAARRLRDAEAVAPRWSPRSQATPTP